jgi:hypothetical protein
MSDQRDLDEILLYGSRTTASPARLAASRSYLQEILDRATGGGPGPRWDNQPARWQDGKRCVVFHGSSQCPFAAVWSAWIGCPHEHIASSGVCDACITDIEHFRGGWRCSLCWDATGEVVLALFITKERLDADADLGC